MDTALIDRSHFDGLGVGPRVIDAALVIERELAGMACDVFDLLRRRRVDSAQRVLQEMVNLHAGWFGVLSVLEFNEHQITQIERLRHSKVASLLGMGLEPDNLKPSAFMQVREFIIKGFIG